jgi:hypothetical protein
MNLIEAMQMAKADSRDFGYDLALEDMVSEIVGEHLEDLTQHAYAAYVEAVGGTTWDGKPIPKWNEIKDRQREGWRSGVKAAFNRRVEVLKSALANPPTQS